MTQITKDGAFDVVTKITQAKPVIKMGSSFLDNEDQQLDFKLVNQVSLKDQIIQYGDGGGGATP